MFTNGGHRGGRQMPIGLLLTAPTHTPDPRAVSASMSCLIGLPLEILGRILPCLHTPAPPGQDIIETDVVGRVMTDFARLHADFSTA